MDDNIISSLLMDLTFETHGNHELAFHKLMTSAHYKEFIAGMIINRFIKKKLILHKTTYFQLST
jgi:hypothetical protein